MLGLHTRLHLTSRPRYLWIPAGPHRVLVIGGGLTKRLKRNKAPGTFWIWGCCRVQRLDRCCQARRDQYWKASHP